MFNKILKKIRIIYLKKEKWVANYFFLFCLIMVFTSFIFRYIKNDYSWSFIRLDRVTIIESFNQFLTTFFIIIIFFLLAQLIRIYFNINDEE